MEYVGFVFGIFGLIAFAELSSLKKKIGTLEEQLAKTEGTPAFEERNALVEALQSYIGKPVVLELKEDFGDVDVMSYGNTKHGSNTILDADDEWVLVRIESPKGTKEKLLRVGAVQRVSAPKE